MSTESLLQRRIVLDLGALPGVIVYRNSVGVAEHTRDDGTVTKRAYGLGPGTPDLIVLVGDRLVGLEVKTDDGRQSPVQRQVQQQWDAIGARYRVVRSVAEARAMVDEVRRG